MIEDTRMTVPARLMKLKPRSPMLCSTFLALGKWYAGSSMTNGAGSPANILVFLSMMPLTMIAAMPMKYAETATQPALWNSAPAISAMMGIFAPQGMKVVVMMVILRSWSFSIVREAMTPGTPQPVPMSIGMKLLPERPNLRKMRSMMNAMRAM